MDKRQQNVIKKIEQLYEYSFFNRGVYEDGEQGGDAQGQQDDQMGGDPNAMPQGGGQMDMGADPSMMGGDQNTMPQDNGQMDMGSDPNMMGGDPNAMPQGGDQMDMGADPSMMGGAPNAMPMGDMGADPTMMGGADQPGPDDNVVDISQLTDTQEQMQQTIEQNAEEQNAQIQDIDGKFSTLLKLMNKFNQALDSNDAKINDLKKEIAKRNPTEEETMNVRLKAGGNPFEQKPEEFWNNFQDINNHYNITANNDAPQYQIRKGDIDNINDKMVSDSFDEIPSTLKDYFVK